MGLKGSIRGGRLGNPEIRVSHTKTGATRLNPAINKGNPPAFAGGFSLFLYLLYGKYFIGRVVAFY